MIHMYLYISGVRKNLFPKICNQKTVKGRKQILAIGHKCFLPKFLVLGHTLPNRWRCRYKAAKQRKRTESHFTNA